MFVRAIDIAAKFTRPIHTLARNYGSSSIQAGASTLFFVNADGWALTCGHVAKLALAAEQLGQMRESFRKELSNGETGAKGKQFLKQLERKYELSKNRVFEIKNYFVGCVEGDLDAEMKLHPDLDVALIHFRNYSKLECSSFPSFSGSGSDLKPGKFLCRLGFPFPEFSNFKFNADSDSIELTTTGQANTPRFPMEGMITRLLLGNGGRVTGFEMSTPGLKGQSGGPAFDQEGRVWGMQCATAHLDLDFDVNQEVIRQGKKKRVSDSAFLHVGHCIHIEVLKEFMRTNGVAFAES